MKVIIFAGGTGKRFWPASRKHSPKQFKDVIDKKPLIQLKYEYLRNKYAPEDIFLSTGAQYEGEVKEILSELPDENFIFEPSMRDNGPAVALAVAYVSKLHPDEVISTQWSDHHIKDPQVFVDALEHAENLVSDEKKTAVIGVPARFPSPHRGYIKFGNELDNLDESGRIKLHEFAQFVEKPDEETAVEYVKSGDYSWNPAYFVSTAENYLNKYQEHAPEMFEVVNEIVESGFSEEALEKYENLEKIGFDYIFSENLTPEEARVINVDMGWSDVGEWIALKEALQKPNSTNVTLGKSHDIESEDTLVVNYEKKKLVATIGLEGMVVVNTPDVIAVFHKKDNAKLKQFLAELEEKGHDQYL